MKEIGWKERLLDTFFPQYNTCHICGAGIPSGLCSILCERCLDRLNDCRIHPRETAQGGYQQLDMTFSAYWHDDAAREMVYLLKYQSDAFAADLLGDGMSHALMTVMERYGRPDCLVPVPLHPRRQAERGYNQSWLLAKIVEKRLGIPVAGEILERTVYIASQTTRSREERLASMQGIFALKDQSILAGKHVLLIDDVLTTGATAMSCAGVLREGGAESVMLLTANRA